MVHTQHMLSTQRLPAQHSRLPFAHVVMSADEHHNTVFQAIRDGAEEYLVKPVTKKEVQNIWQYVWKRLSAAQLHVKVEVGTSTLVLKLIAMFVVSWSSQLPVSSISSLAPHGAQVNRAMHVYLRAVEWFYGPRQQTQVGTCMQKIVW